MNCYWLPNDQITFQIVIDFRVIGVEDKENWHGKPLPKDMAEQAIKEIEGKSQGKRKLTPALPVEDAPPVNIKNIKMSPPNFKLGEMVCKAIIQLEHNLEADTAYAFS